MPWQKGWMWCNKCQVLCFTGRGPGPCHVGGNHDFAGSGNYSLFRFQQDGNTGMVIREVTPPSAQDNWRWCNKCQEVCYHGTPRIGTCPAGGAHDYMGSDWRTTGSGDIVMMQGQSNWRWCNKCMAMCFAGNADLGPCPGGGVHDHGGSGDYSLMF
jgi:hypothetical protein